MKLIDRHAMAGISKTPLAQSFRRKRNGSAIFSKTWAIQPEMFRGVGSATTLLPWATTCSPRREDCHRS